MDEKQSVTISADYAIAQLIFQQAQWQAKCKPVGTSAESFRITPEDLKDAADLVFLALELIAERKVG